MALGVESSHTAANAAGLSAIHHFAPDRPTFHAACEEERHLSSSRSTTGHSIGTPATQSRGQH